MFSDQDINNVSEQYSRIKITISDSEEEVTKLKQ